MKTKIKQKFIVAMSFLGLMFLLVYFNSHFGFDHKNCYALAQQAAESNVALFEMEIIQLIIDNIFQASHITP